MNARKIHSVAADELVYPVFPVDRDRRFRMGGAYRLIEEDSRYYLQHTVTGGRVETDKIGKTILDCLPGSWADTLKRLNTTDNKAYVSERLVGYYFLLFWQAGVFESEINNGSASTKHHTSTKAVHIGGPGGALPPPAWRAPWPSGRPPGEPPEASNDSAMSVVIVTFNGDRFIRQNLETLHAQTLPAAEIIVVDNASSDGTPELVEKEFKGVKVIRNKKNYHYAQAVNIGVEAASNELVVILNQDIQLDPHFLQMLYQRYNDEENKETVAAVVPQMRFSKLQRFINGIGNFVTHRGWGSDNYFGALDVGQFENLKYSGSACFGAVLVTRRGWREVGPLDKGYRSFYEDTDWSIRVHLKGMRILAAPKSLVYHEFGGSYPSGLKLSFVLRNRMRFVLKNLKGKPLRRFFKAYLKQDIKNTLAILRGRAFRDLVYYFRAYWSLLFKLPGIITYRLFKSKDLVPADEFFTKGAPYVVLSNQKLEPVINRHVIRNYYYFAVEMPDAMQDAEVVYSE